MALSYQPTGSHRLSELFSLELRAHPYPWSEKTLSSCLGDGYWGESLQEGERLLGFYLFQQVLDEVTLVNICIDPNRRGQGLGRLLLERAMTKAAQRGVAQAFLEVRAGNLAALGLYRASGWQEDCRRKGYYPAGEQREDAVLMSIALGA
ncbi:ribosomal protein S18-alanine N-acetyltransferase [Ferrimonas marina]|uniref:[Ribosomal protein bS18]-alanine N-acetyltransferase n=1 Tax=Ferrimonas marina TaxID=299255 RepID=A0A1M5W0T0_9GAMM|nr:ribosomal protein S18-alanine N-acetyltransferase [Ferrimonas marina]SHH81038.1 ribosomal-protein-alanine N-acetyltransferase [Ferrimonas marina]